MTTIEILKKCNPNTEFKKFMINPYLLAEYSAEYSVMNVKGIKYTIAHVYNIWTQLPGLESTPIYARLQVAAIFNTANENEKIIMVDDTFMNYSQQLKDFIIYHEIGHVVKEAWSRNDITKSSLWRKSKRIKSAKPEAIADAYSLYINDISLEDYDIILDILSKDISLTNNELKVMEIRREMAKDIINKRNASRK